MRRYPSAFVALLAAPLLTAATFKGGTLEPPRPAPDFALQRADGGQFRLSQHRGQVAVMTFGYTFCPDVCPATLAEFAQIRARLGVAERRVHLVFITVLEPGQTYRVPFRAATTFQLACSVHEGGQVGIVVTAAPPPGWARRQRRFLNLIGR